MKYEESIQKKILFKNMGGNVRTELELHFRKSNIWLKVIQESKDRENGKEEITKEITHKTSPGLRDKNFQNKRVHLGPSIMDMKRVMSENQNGYE